MQASAKGASDWEGQLNRNISTVFRNVKVLRQAGATKKTGNLTGQITQLIIDSYITLFVL